MSLGHGASIVRNGLVLHLDAASVRSYPGSGTVLTDLSGRDHNASLVNGTTYNSGNIGHFVLDGAGDYINASFSESSITIEGGFTWSVLVNIDNLTNTNTGFMSTYVGTSAGTATAIKVKNSKFELRSYGLGLIQTSPNTISLGEWTMFTAVWKNSGRYEMYENGVLVKSGSSSTTYTPSNGSVMRIGGGAYSMGTDADLDGKLSSAQVYNRALSSEEIQRNFNALRGRYGI